MGYRNKSTHSELYIMFCFILVYVWKSKHKYADITFQTSCTHCFIQVLSYFLHCLWVPSDSSRSLFLHYLIVFTLYKCPLPIPPPCMTYYQFHEFSCHISLYIHFFKSTVINKHILNTLLPLSFITSLFGKFIMWTVRLMLSCAYTLHFVSIHTTISFLSFINHVKTK